MQNQRKLLREGQSLPPFTLKTTEGDRLGYATLAWKRRVVVVLLPETPGERERAWLREARNGAAEFAERDMTVLVLHPSPEMVAELKGLPDPFRVLHDTGGKVSAQLGEAPALYLVGKDRGVKRASRTFAPPADLFRTVDAMPMRRQEMRRKGDE